MLRKSLPWLTLSIGIFLVGCTAADYSEGITNFSQAVTNTNTAEQTLIAADQQARLSEWAQQALRADPLKVSVDFAKCRAQPDNYHAGDCAVMWQSNAAPTTLEQSSLTSLVSYASLLSAVVADKTCSTLQSDAQSLATSLGDLAKDAQTTQLASDTGPITTIASGIGCFFIQEKQLSILRAATSQANPIIQKLIPIIVSKDTAIYDIVLRDNISQLNDAEVSYNQTRSASDLAHMVSLAGAINSAKLNPPGPAIAKIAPLHQALTDDLAAPTVNLKRVENDAQALITQAQTVVTSLQTLQTSANAAPSPTSKPSKSKTSS